jgi:hypothetical protein
MSDGKQVLRRTFEAKTHPEMSEKRAELNMDALTSVYFSSYKYMTREPALMSDGSQNPSQKFKDKIFRTKREAEGDANA